ncbi:putative cytoplasm to vacuole targeting Vps64 [Aspergillus stella-maris]|uniref:putative cytoplasm to vacuole targeting Vps64 n=1 Tax=Aspergillus stella-maris TaxID=1810926 RepID=UPI003CCCF60E
MTAVASPPSVQTGPRLGWYDSDGGQGALSAMNNQDEVSRMFASRNGKPLHRSNSSSSIGSNSSTSTIIASPSPADAGQPNGEAPTLSKKKSSSRVWPSSKAEPVSGITARSQAKPAFFSGAGASSAMSAVQQPQSILPSQQHLSQTPQQNGVRAGSTPAGEPPAILTLIPINGTFDRKQINLPFYPETLRIGRQTNQKTQPTSKNGFFDSKVLSRQHAEIWADRAGKVWIRDVKSSNGTFLNGQRLSPENRESEPHEIRENDTLELGIDIVSEDQKTIVHHKVSAKVEHAGIYGSVPNIFDLTLGDLDPASGNGLLPSPLSQPLSHMRGRAGSASSMRSTQSNASQFSAMQQQRQMNYWSSPLSIEQIVKRLTTEMKQAKQQQQDLRQTDEFLTGLMKPGAVEKEKQKHSPGDSGSRQLNGRPKMPRMDSFSRFSEPPAPPPQQPLPEKPDAPPRNGVDAISPLKRADTEKPKMSAGSSPVSRESSQILSLIEALSSAKRELDSQGARVKELENLLLQERHARESAEEKAKTLELSAKESDRSTLQSDGVPEVSDEDTVKEPEAVLEDAPSVPAPEGEQAVENQTDKMQRRLDSMMEEMTEMRKQLSSYKDRAQKAETETGEARKSLAEMVETLRKERAGARPQDDSIPQVQTGKAIESQPDDDSTASKFDKSQHAVSPPPNGTGSPGTVATQTHRRLDAIEQSSPLASMLGVVLLGVGLMTYLNVWQKMEK